MVDALSLGVSPAPLREDEEEMDMVNAGRVN
jgi:hypothetical protein